jgi:hypothetical protein
MSTRMSAARLMQSPLWPFSAVVLADLESEILVNRRSRLEIAFERRGKPARAIVTVAEDPSLELVTLEASGETPTEAQQTFRNRWLGSLRR